MGVHIKRTKYARTSTNVHIAIQLHFIRKFSLSIVAM